jgi:hypothetical protein
LETQRYPGGKVLARLVPLVLTVATVSTVPSEAWGQRVPDLTTSARSSFVPDPPMTAVAAPVDSVSRPASPLEQQRVPHPGSFVGVTVVSAIFGGLGAVAGAYVSAGMGPGGDEALGSAIRGALFGAWVGAGLGGTAVSRRPGRAFLGSAVGLLPGVAILHQADDGRGALLGFVVQGMVTALFTQAGS